MDANAKLILGTAYFGATHFFERISYYGFRTLLVMYAVNELAFSEASSYGLYENFTLIVYLIPLIVGPFLDFVFKAKHGPVIGGLFSVVGLIVAMIPDHLALSVAVVFIGIGSSFSRLGIFMGLGNLFSRRDNRRDAAFSLDYIAVNLGALIATTAIAFIGENNGFNVAFSICAVFSFLSAVLPLIVNLTGAFKKTNAGKSPFANQLDGVHEIERESELNTVQFLPKGEQRMRPLTLIYLFLSSVLIWVIFEQASMKSFQLTDRGNLFLSAQMYLTMFGLLVLSVILFFVNRKRHMVHYLYLGGLAMLMSLMTLVVVNFSSLGTQAVTIGFVLFGTLTEILLTPIIISYITRLVSPSFTGMALGVFFASFALMSWIGKHFDQGSTVQWALIVVLAIVLIIGGLLIKLLGIRKESF
ncbi:MAG: MFS transporter [Flavobacteriales bacterium]|nr:MFS transporter [Flavobacteriales bacterium]MDG1780001.1 MFS transporter [Flavobacteriales bacterium]MDG2245560.1 MFS transporter [Flavobacteriales bacterium]